MALPPPRGASRRAPRSGNRPAPATKCNLRAEKKPSCPLRPRRRPPPEPSAPLQPTVTKDLNANRAVPRRRPVTGRQLDFCPRLWPGTGRQPRGVLPRWGKMPRPARHRRGGLNRGPVRVQAQYRSNRPNLWRAKPLQEANRRTIEQGTAKDEVKRHCCAWSSTAGFFVERNSFRFRWETCAQRNEFRSTNRRQQLPQRATKAATTTWTFSSAQAPLAVSPPACRSSAACGTGSCGRVPGSARRASCCRRPTRAHGECTVVRPLPSAPARSDHCRR